MFDIGDCILILLASHIPSLTAATRSGSAVMLALAAVFVLVVLVIILVILVCLSSRSRSGSGRRRLLADIAGNSSLDGLRHDR